MRTLVTVRNKSRSARRDSRQRGFTLLEIMVALAVIGIGLAAVMSAISTTVNNAAGLQERTFAQWVAMNKLADMQINHEWPGPRSYDGSSVMAEHEWFWDMEVKETEDKTIRRVEIKVRANEDDETSLVTLVGFVGKSTT
jgi:general secretion pathway protein I